MGLDNLRYRFIFIRSDEANYHKVDKHDVLPEVFL